jgi:phosphatidylglycerol:prolipoprotein diacylglycerol transferase
VTSDNPSPGSAYTWLILSGIAVSVWFWLRLARRDSRLPAVYVGGLLGAFVGAKLLYVAIDGWRFVGQPDLWLRLATGKSILGRYPAAILVSSWPSASSDTLVSPVTGSRWWPRGDRRRRTGCLVHGCHGGPANGRGSRCDAAGVDRWPAVQIEILFNVAMLALFLDLRRKDDGRASISISTSSATALPISPRVSARRAPMV